MGYSKNVYIGPYLEVNGVMQKSVPKIKRVCPNHGETKTNDKFCSKCGSEILNQDYEEIIHIKPNLFAHQNFDDDGLWQPENVPSFIPNKQIPNRFKIDSDYGGTCDIGGNQHLIPEQIDWFIREYNQEITKFVEAFGSNNVIVHWGVIVYWS